MKGGSAEASVIEEQRGIRQLFSRLGSWETQEYHPSLKKVISACTVGSRQKMSGPGMQTPSTHAIPLIRSIKTDPLPAILNFTPFGNDRYR